MPVLPVILPLGLSFLASALGEGKARGTLLGALAALASLGSLVSSAAMLLNPRPYHLGGWPSELGIALAGDELAATSIALFSAVWGSSFACALARGQASGKRGSLSLLLLAAINGAVLTADLFNLYVFLELISISACALVANEEDPGSFEAAFRYLIFSFVAGSAFLLGVLLLFSHSGTLNLAVLRDRLGEVPKGALELSFALMALGLFVKSGLFPGHLWLLEAHPRAQGPVSSVLSALVVWAPAAASARLFHLPGLEIPSTEAVATALALLSVGLGHALALREANFKRMLAASTTASMGMVYLLTLHAGETAAALFAAGHALYKGPLFLLSGPIKEAAGPGIRGLRGIRPASATLWLAVAISLASALGLPPFLSFWAKAFPLLEPGIGPLAPISLLASAALSLPYLIGALRSALSGKGGSWSRPKLEESSALLMALLSLLLGTLLLLGPGPLRLDSARILEAMSR